MMQPREFHLEADPGNPICDFCSAQNPHWEFQIEPHHEIGVDRIGGSNLHSMDEDGRWAACDICKEFIMQRKNSELARHSVDSFYRIFSIIPESERSNVLARVRQAHNFFFSRWDGSEPKRDND